MSDAGAILDYASPRKRGALRLPAVSRLAVEMGEGRMVIEESLTGQAGAFLALCFSVVVLLVIGSDLVSAVYDSRHRRVHPDWPTAGVFGAVLVGYLALMVAVLQQNWRRTLLAVEYDDLRLSFLSPLRRRRHCWTGSAIADVVMANTAETGSGLPLAEVLITRVAGGDIRLFTDHPAYRLESIARAIHDLLRHGEADAPPDDPLLARFKRIAGPRRSNI